MQDRRMSVEKVIFFVWPMLASLICFAFRLNFLWSIALFFVIPSVYLASRDSVMAKKALIFAIPSFALIIPVDYMAHASSSWYVYSIFDFRVLGLIPVEDIILFFFYVFFPIMYYEYFLDHKFKDKPAYPREKYLYLLFTIILVIFLMVFVADPDRLKVKYFYLWFGLSFILLPVCMRLLKFSPVVTKFIKTTSYFAFLNLIHFMTCVALGFWFYPGTDFIGWVSVFNLRFPLEELIFWIGLGAFSILTMYQFFDNKAD